MQDVKRLTLGEAREIYKRYYWDAVNGDMLPLGLDLAVYDFAVNSGPSRAVRFLQKVVGTKVDGKMGPNTLHSVSVGNPQLDIAALCDNRLAFLKRLKTWPTFGRGWERRVNGIKSKALLMATSSKVLKPRSDPSIIELIIKFLSRLFK